jgi:hypothetical protein
LHASLGKKYGIVEFAFDVECIYEAAHLTELVDSMLTLGAFQYTNLNHGLDSTENEYFSLFEILNEKYEFRTSSEDDYVDLTSIMSNLERLVNRTKPEYQYNLSNKVGGQVAYLIFAKTETLQKAVDEGYPCTLPTASWNLQKEWQSGTYSDIKLDKVPDFEDLKKKYIQTITELYEKGFNVPKLTIQRIYIDDIFKDGSLDVIIDGALFNSSLTEINDKTIRCSWYSWDVLLAYTLITKYNGLPTMFIEEQSKYFEISSEAYIEKAELAFGKRH